jgi:predicted transcriptional regulator
VDLSEQQKPLQRLSIPRRSRAATKALRAEMHAMEAAGKSRKEIGLTLGLSSSMVTQFMGAKRPYRWRRMVPR